MKELEPMLFKGFDNEICGRSRTNNIFQPYGSKRTQNLHCTTKFKPRLLNTIIMGNGSNREGGYQATIKSRKIENYTHNFKQFTNSEKYIISFKEEEDDSLDAFQII